MYNEDYIEEGEQNLYKENAREESLDNDEISAEEEAFMKGYDEAEEESRQSDDEDDEDED